jgi:hypothetical protein
MKNKTKLAYTRKLTMYLFQAMNEIEPMAYDAHERIRRMWYELTPRRRLKCLYVASQTITEKWTKKLI